MAVTLNFARDMNCFGNKKQDWLTAAFAEEEDTSKAIETRLNWIDHVQVTNRGNADMQVTAYPNSKTASTTEDDPGWVFLANVTDATATYVLVMTGR